MRGVGEAPAADDRDAVDLPEPAAETTSPRSVLFTWTGSRASCSPASP
jgi:hypothetical protein